MRQESTVRETRRCQYHAFPSDHPFIVQHPTCIQRETAETIKHSAQYSPWMEYSCAMRRCEIVYAWRKSSLILVRETLHLLQSQTLTATGDQRARRYFCIPMLPITLLMRLKLPRRDHSYAQSRLPKTDGRRILQD